MPNHSENDLVSYRASLVQYCTYTYSRHVRANQSKPNASILLPQRNGVVLMSSVGDKHQIHRPPTMIFDCALVNSSLTLLGLGVDHSVSACSFSVELMPSRKKLPSIFLLRLHEVAGMDGAACAK